MTDQSTDTLFAGPLIPRPEMTAVAMRAAVEVLDPQQLAEFDADEVRGWPTFLPAWSLWVERNRFPVVQERIRELEVAMGEAHSDEGGRAVATAMSELLYVVSDRLPWARRRPAGSPSSGHE